MTEMQRLREFSKNEAFAPTEPSERKGRALSWTAQSIMNNSLMVCGKTYRLIQLLGKGKGGYSYLAECEGLLVVVKQIHHEPCDYYSFGNKIEAELRDYERLRKAGIRIPRLHTVDTDAERIVKDYIEGPTVS